MPSDPRTSKCRNPACQSTRLSTVLERQDTFARQGHQLHFQYRWAYCEDCGLAFVDPEPTPEVLQAAYSAGYVYYDQAPTNDGVTQIAKWWLAARRHRALVSSQPASTGAELARLVEMVTRRDVSYSLGIPLALPRTSAILDYGCGSGDWLVRMHRLGYTRLFGYDIPANAQAGDRLRSLSIGFQQAGSLENAFPSERFDCVRLEHAFEHLVDPLAVLRQIRASLNPHGYLVMTFPSIHAWEPVESLPASPYLAYLQLPIHIFHHSLRSTKDYLSSADFHILEIKLLRPHHYISVVATPLQPATLMPKR